ncbi:hypothetical protein FHS92_003032 [Sphingobium subterraneum]|uniref:Uncharacterized protein n=1 Tax=Sphingobium subterraneum TaxID=627688 RepID=A0A841JAW4_9SPHN|nr:hypothetical protein [Sphingobium subterraneum]
MPLKKRLGQAVGLEASAGALYRRHGVELGATSQRWQSEMVMIAL